jgi:hypothetical protein
MWTLLLAVLPLDLAGASAAVQKAPPEVVIRLEVAGARYKITHRYTGTGARRFVTGATDKNCDEPIDVLLLDGKVTPLFSELPCGGFAFRMARTMKTGEEWTIEGSMPVEGSHTVVARYCPAVESLKRVDPKVKNQREPPWWLGCVDSPPVSTSIKR